MKEPKKSKKTPSLFDYSEFTWGFNSSVSGKNLHSVSRHSRKEKLTECRLHVTDKITNLEENYTIPAGHYSKKEMQKLRQDALDKTILSLMKKRKK